MEEFKKHFQNICNSLAEIYLILYKNKIDDSELKKTTSDLYNILNKIENNGGF